MKRFIVYYAKDGRKVIAISPHWFKVLCDLIARAEEEGAAFVPASVLAPEVKK